MIKYNITDYLKDDKELQKAVISELLNENIKLNNIIDSYQPKMQALKDENKQLREKLQTNYNDDIKKSDEIFLLACKKNSYLQALQEIKEIVEYIMTSDTEKWTLDEPFKQIEKILDLITKAEEE